MSDIFDGIGTASEGGLFARALEPDSGAKPPHPHQPAECLNCGTPLTGAYCHACGQQGHVHRTIGAFMHDLLHGALHFEGKLWRTLPMLALKPGQLTRRYIEGERARFVSPMALFLFCVFLMFAVFQIAGITTPTSLQDDNEFISGVREGYVEDHSPTTVTANGETVAEPVTLDTALIELQRERDALQARLDAMGPDDAGRAEVQAELAGTDQALAMMEGTASFTDEDGEFSTGVGWIDDKLIGKWRENPGLMLYKLQANAYKFSWLLIPISIPFVWLLFVWKRRFKAYDHAIFVTYSLSFITLLFIALSLLNAIGTSSWLILLLGAAIPPVHLYKQLRHAYELRRYSALWRLLVLSAFIWIIVLLFVQVLFLLGAL